MFRINPNDDIIIVVVDKPEQTGEGESPQLLQRVLRVVFIRRFDTRDPAEPQIKTQTNNR